MTAILHLSDLHIGNDKRRDQHAKTLVAIIKERWSGADKPLLLVTGDFVDDGRESQYRVAGRLVNELRQAGFTLLALPGNHDYGWNGNRATPRCFNRFRRHLLGGSQVSYPEVMETRDGSAIVLLNSMQSECGFWDGLLANGELGGEQLGKLRDTLAALQARRAEGAKVIVALHHHSFLFPNDGVIHRTFERLGHFLKDATAFLETIAGPPPLIDALLFGHEHRHTDFSKDYPLANLPAKYGIPTLLCCGSSTIPDAQTGAFPAWLLTLDQGALRVENPELAPPSPMLPIG